MANLLPPSNYSIVKSTKSGIIKPDKFLNVKSKTASVGIKNQQNNSPKLLEDTITKIERKVIQIDKLLKDSLFISKKDIEKKRKGEEKKEFEEREKQLEKKKPPKVKGINLPTPPRMGFLDWIKNFITQTILGFIAVRLIDYLPKLLNLLPTIIKVTDFITDVGGKMLDGLITFIDWGYKAYDATRGFIKNIGGEGLAKNLDTFAGALNGLLDAAIIAALAASSMGGGDSGGLGGKGGRPGFDSKGRRVSTGVQKRYAQRYGREQFLDRFGTKNLKNLSGGIQRNALQKGARSAFVNLAGKGGAKAILKFTRPLLKRLPIIGALIDFGLSVALGESPGRAAFKAIGAGLLGAVGAAIGSVVPVAGNIIGGIIGGIAGDAIGGTLYDMFFGNKTPKKSKVVKAAGGGKPSSSGGKSISPTRRTIKKKKKTRTASFIPTKIKPGRNTGGEDKVQKVFPNPEKPGGLFGFLFGGGNKQQQESKEQAKPKEKSANPQEFLIKSNDVLGKADFFGPFFTLAYKAVLGDKPNKLDYVKAGQGLNAWMQNTFKSGPLGFAGGGEVDARQFFEGEDFTNVIAKSVEDSVSKEVNTTIRDLAKELTLRPVGRDEMIQKNIEKAKEEDSLDVGPGATVTGGNADFWTLVAIARMEDSDPQGSADVAQSIYNRVASGIYGGKTIKEIVLRQGQYEPTWKYPRRGKTGVPNPEWHAIKDLASASAATGISQSDLQRTAAALRNSKYQEEARKFVGGRTDFMGGSNQPGPGDVRRTTNTPNNFFGWFVGPAAKAYGAKNPGPAKVPQLGDIVVMGGGTTGAEPLGKGYGSAGSKIAGELGRYIKKKLRQGPDFSQVHRHPEHPPYSLTSGHSRGSLHYQGRAIDIGAYTHEQGPILKVISEFNRMKGVKPVQLLHGKNEPSDHSNHVHVAYARGGPTLDGPHMAMVGEEGQEYVLDADSYESTEKVVPGLLDILNYDVHDKASLQKNMPSIIASLSQYTDYEMPGGSPEVAFIPMPMPESGGASGGASKSSMSVDYSTIDTYMSSQMGDQLMYG